MKLTGWTSSGRALGIVAVWLVASCGSTGSAALGTGTTPTTVSGNAVPVVDLAKVEGLAVVDGEHAVVISVGQNRERILSAAALMDGHGTLKPLPLLPELMHVGVFALDKGFAILGSVCQDATRPSVDQRGENVCDEAIPTVAFLHRDGTIDKIVQGPRLRSWADLSGSSIGTALVVRGDAASPAYQVTTAGFENFDVPGTRTWPCRIRSGVLIAADVTSADPARSDGSPATLQFLQGHDNAWKPLGTPITVSNRTGDTAQVQCVPGGIVTNRGMVDSTAGFKALPTHDTHGASVSGERVTSGAAGIDADGRVYLEPNHSDSPPLILGDPGAGPEVKPTDRWVAVSLDGRWVALGGDEVGRIVPTT